jgi:gas vesicle protein
MTAETSGFAGASSSQPAGSEMASPAEAWGTLKRQGQQLREETRDGIQRFATQRKQEAASFLKDVSNALDEITSKLGEQGHDRIARYAGAAAEKLRQVGDDLPRRISAATTRRSAPWRRS